MGVGRPWTPAPRSLELTGSEAISGCPPPSRAAWCREGHESWSPGDWAWALSHNKTRCRCCWGYGEEPQSQRAHACTPGRRSSFRRSWEAGRGWNKKLVSLSRHEPHRPTLSWWPGSAQLASSGQQAGRLLAPVCRTGPQASQCRWRDACGSPWGAWAACSAVVCRQLRQRQPSGFHKHTPRDSMPALAGRAAPGS